MVGRVKKQFTDAEQRERRITSLRAQALAALAQLTHYCENDIPCPGEAGWPDIEWQADVNRHLCELRDRVLRLGEYAPPAPAVRETNCQGDEHRETNCQGDEWPAPARRGDEL